MKKTFLFVAVLLLTALLAAPAIAGDYVKRGTIHLPTNYYGCGGYWAQGVSEFSNILIVPHNRGDKQIEFFIDFYYSDENDELFGQKAGRFPENAGEWHQLLPHTSKTLINCTTGLRHLEPYKLLSGVLTWRGKVDITPYCGVLNWYRDALSGDLISSESHVFYDDSIR